MPDIPLVAAERGDKTQRDTGDRLSQCWLCHQAVLVHWLRSANNTGSRAASPVLPKAAIRQRCIDITLPFRSIHSGRFSLWRYVL
jgi:hypothetical protein